jgi:hypothetical protein
MRPKPVIAKESHATENRNNTSVGGFKNFMPVLIKETSKTQEANTDGGE